MKTSTDATGPALPQSVAPDISRVAQEGIAAGIVGAAIVAFWFLLLDLLSGRPLYTPTVLGTALFRGGRGLANPEQLAVSTEMVLMYTWVHALAFCVIGGVASQLLAASEKNPHIGFGIILLFILLECGFLLAASVFAEGVLGALAWQAVLIGNLLAAAGMAVYLGRRHPTLEIRP